MKCSQVSFDCIKRDLKYSFEGIKSAIFIKCWSASCQAVCWLHILISNIYNVKSASQIFQFMLHMVSEQANFKVNWKFVRKMLIFNKRIVNELRESRIKIKHMNKTFNKQISRQPHISISSIHSLGGEKETQFLSSKVCLRSTRAGKKINKQWSCEEKKK